MFNLREGNGIKLLSCTRDCIPSFMYVQTYINIPNIYIYMHTQTNINTHMCEYVHIYIIYTSYIHTDIFYIKT